VNEWIKGRMIFLDERSEKVDGKEIKKGPIKPLSN
jgi:hypothetical protein